MDGEICVGRFRLRGVAAEVVSVLRSRDVLGDILDEAGWNQVAAALDTTNPADERAKAAADLIECFHRADPLLAWVPRFSSLERHEFRQAFYSGYRDHTIHTLQVWLLGHYLFATVDEIRGRLSSYLEARAATARSPQELFRQWWMSASFWHDSGYPFEADGFSTTEQKRADLLASIEDGLNQDAFTSGLLTAGVANPHDRVLRKRIHRAGRYSPLLVDTSAAWLADADPRQVLNNLWWRLGVARSVASPVAAIDLATTTMTSDREPYHDHGIYGALLLLAGYRHSEEFLRELAESIALDSFSDLRSQLGEAADRIPDAYLEFLDAEPIIDMASEAIAYHNLNYRSLDGRATEQLSAETGGRPCASWASEPHIVFLALVDTLQDWDRHRYVPGAKQGRKMVRSSDMMLQGKPTHVGITLRGKKDPATSVRNLFDGWISGIDALFQNGAGFSVEAEVDSPVDAPSVAEARRIQELLRSYGERLQDGSQRARESLIAGGDDCLKEVATILQPLLRDIDRLRSRLASDRVKRQLKEIVESSGISVVERHAAVEVAVGKSLESGSVVSQIGEGGFGQVFLVESLVRNKVQRRAYKVFHSRDLGDSDKRFYFERGFDAMQALIHEPGVVSVHEFTRVPFGFSMDYIRGENLEQQSSKVGTCHDKLRLLQRIAEILAASHQKGIIHRDVKPANILLDADNDGEPVLTDYDLAHITGRSTLAKTLWVSEAYGAPEQRNARYKKFSSKPSVDVYSFGALLYFVMTGGKPPLAGGFGSEQARVMQQILDGLLPATVVRDLVLLLEELTTENPQERLGDVPDVEQMEQVVSRLAALRRISAASDFGELDPESWIAEVVYTATGKAIDGGRTVEFLSRSGGSSWRLELSVEDRSLTCTSCLRREPRMQGVNYEGFARNTAHLVDRAIGKVPRVSKAPRCNRHGLFSGAGREMRIVVDNTELTRQFAHHIGELISAVNRAVE